MWNPWVHVRLAGSIAIIVAFFIHSLPLTFIGLGIQYLGVFGSVNRLEQIIEKMLPAEDDDAVR